MKIIKKVLKRLIFSFFLLYGYNNIMMSINMDIPINIYTLALITVFGVPYLVIFVLIKIILFV